MDKLKDLAFKMGVITTQDLRVYTTLELIMKVVDKINELVQASVELSEDVQKAIDDMNATINGLLTSGMHEEVVKKMYEWLNDGTLESLINETALKNVNDKLTDSGIDRVLATGKFVTNMNSWLGLVNTKYLDDNAVRFYLLPKAKVTTGVGGCLKIFADDYQNNADYRDLGIYFHANQKGDTGYHGTGVNWFNVKVLDGGEYDGKHPDMGFSFQDGQVVAGRISCFNNSTPVWTFGGKTPTAHQSGNLYIAEFQDKIAFHNDKGIEFLNADMSIGGSVRVNASGDMVHSIKTKESHYVGGNSVYYVDANKAHFEKSTYHDANVVFTNSSNGVVLVAPGGKRFKLKVSDSGALSTEEIVG